METRPGDQILDGSRDQHLARPRERRDARGDMNGDAPHFVRGNFNLAGMQAAADLNAERVSRRAPRSDICPPIFEDALRESPERSHARLTRERRGRVWTRPR